jgi:hypothetical protein
VALGRELDGERQPDLAQGDDTDLHALFVFLLAGVTAGQA